jgi:hypothetical protein
MGRRGGEGEEGLSLIIAISLLLGQGDSLLPEEGADKALTGLGKDRELLLGS